jgi:AraC-like DNA-binding protein
MPNGSHPVSSGDAVVIPPMTPHTYIADELDPWSIWWLHATGSDVEELVDAIVGSERRPVVPLRDAYTAVGFIEHIVASLEHDETLATLYESSGGAWRLLCQLAADRLRGVPATTDRIQIVQDYLRSNLSAVVSVGELSRLAGLSASHFSALFKASTGIGVMEYVKRLRSARARELLLTTTLSIAEVAERVGYTDAFYFSRQFRAINGTSPRQFRDRSLRDGY